MQLQPGLSSCGILAGGWARGAWFNALQRPISQRKKLLLCPEAVNWLPLPGGCGFEDYGGIHNSCAMGVAEDSNGEAASYGANLWIYNAPFELQGRPKSYHRGKLSAPANGSRVPLMGDAVWRGEGPHYDEPIAYMPELVPGHYTNTAAFADYEIEHFAIPRHGSGTQLSFFDGSAKSLPVCDLWAQQWSRAWDPEAYRRVVAFPAWLR